MNDRIRGRKHGNRGGRAYEAPMQVALTRPLDWRIYGLAAVAALVVVLVSLPSWSTVHPSRLFTDVEWYEQALPALTSDAPLYDPAKLEPHELQPPPFWNQAPSTAFFASFLLLPGGNVLWGVIMAASVIGGLVLVWPRIGLLGTMLLASALVFWFPIVTALTKGNLNALIFLMLAIALRFPRAAGWTIGIAAAAKLAPVLGVAWLLGKRDWRGAAIALAIPILATLVVLVWKGPDTLVDFFVLRANESKLDQQGRIGVVATLGVSPTVALVLGGLVALLAWWRASFTLAVVAMLISIPVMHSHYWTWLLVPALGIGVPRLLHWVEERSDSGRDRGLDRTAKLRPSGPQSK
jgi:alpha-1,2-mannosyltransferase